MEKIKLIRDGEGKVFTVKDWQDYGYTKPTANSMVILADAIKSTEGHPGKGSLFPWIVVLTEQAINKLALDNPFICRATDLHEIAKKWQELKAKGDD